MDHSVDDNQCKPNAVKPRVKSKRNISMLVRHHEKQTRLRECSGK